LEVCTQEEEGLSAHIQHVELLVANGGEAMDGKEAFSAGGAAADTGKGVVAGCPQFEESFIGVAPGIDVAELVYS
jgi:hypothetical protein